MAIMVECPRCHSVTPFADNDAGLAVSCTGCGRVTRVPDGRARVAEPKVVPAYEPPPALGRVSGSGTRPYLYGAAVVLVAGVAGALGYLKYRAVVASRLAHQAGHGLARAAATTSAATRVWAATAPGAAGPVAGSAVVEAMTKPAALPAVEGPARAVGFVGLERLELNGRYTVDSYDSAEGPYREASAGAMAPLASNLKVRLYGEGRVKGVVRIGERGDVKKADSVRFASAAVKEPERATIVAAPPVNAEEVGRENDNDQLPEKYFRGGKFVLHAGKTVAVAGGAYVLEDLVIEPRATLVLDGPAMFVLTGRLIIHGSVETHERRPANLHVRVAGENRPVVINNSSDVYLDLYAPGHTVEVYGKGGVYGSVVGKILRVNGERALHFDESIAPVLENPWPRR